MTPYYLILDPMERIGLLWFINAYNRMLELKWLMLIVAIIKNFMIDVIIRDIFKMIGSKHVLAKICEVFLGLALTCLMIIISDPRIACYVLSFVIGKCPNIPSSGFFYLLVGMGIFKKIWEAIKEGLKDVDYDGERAKADDERTKAEAYRKKAEKERAELKRLIIEMKAERAHSQNNGHDDSLILFRKKIMNEIYGDLIKMANASMTNAVSNYNGLSFDNNLMSLYDRFGSETSSEPCMEDLLAHCDEIEQERGIYDMC